MEQAYALIAEKLGEIQETDVAQFIQDQFREAGMVTDNIPMVAVQKNCANPHYTPAPITINKNHLIMIDLWAKWEIYADITWMAYSGTSVPDEIQQAWDAVLLARKTATKAIKPGIPGRVPDEKAREILIDAGYEDAIFHRTGHSIDSATHGRGANLDCFEMPETRLLLPNLITSVEPAVYLRNRFGIRSEIDVVVTKTGHRISTPPQENILLI
jgi:Xaa-Pro aminopeptidase